MIENKQTRFNIDVFFIYFSFCIHCFRIPHNCNAYLSGYICVLVQLHGNKRIKKDAQLELNAQHKLTNNKA